MVDCYIWSLSPILGRTRQDQGVFQGGSPLRDPLQGPSAGVPEVPTNNDIAVRNLLGSTTALHLDHSTLASQKSAG